MKKTHLLFFLSINLLLVSCAVQTIGQKIEKEQIIKIIEKDARSITFLYSYLDTDKTIQNAKKWCESNGYDQAKSSGTEWTKKGKKQTRYNCTNSPINKYYTDEELNTGVIKKKWPKYIQDNKENNKENKVTNLTEVQKYHRLMKCYGEMTAAHKARGLHQSNRSLSIKIKETICFSYGEGDINNYEGKK
ncbi:hypothetical protein N9D82_02560 [Gammaproteobacteria bacterium]|nr:hypothetical protein [Gammaproteobacteria bacterium]